MQLTRYTDYSLRVLMYLGVQHSRLVTINELADCFSISRNHLVKVVHNLARAGFIKTVRGKGGGMRLGKQPAQINVGDVIRQTERGVEIMNCEAQRCRLIPGCRFREALDRARGAFLEVLDAYTVADLIVDRGQMLSLLGFESETPDHREIREAS